MSASGDDLRIKLGHCHFKCDYVKGRNGHGTHLILGCVEVLREKRGYVRIVQVAVSENSWFESRYAEPLWFCLPSKKIPRVMLPLLGQLVCQQP